MRGPERHSRSSSGACRRLDEAHEEREQLDRRLAMHDRRLRLHDRRQWAQHLAWEGTARIGATKVEMTQGKIICAVKFEFGLPQGG